LSAEEELTGYKHRITESSGDCGKLARECEDIESVNDDFDQSKMVRLYALWNIFEREFSYFFVLTTIFFVFMIVND
jgi:hypothetical protein